MKQIFNLPGKTIDKKFEDKFKAVGKLSLYKGKAYDIKKDNFGNIINYKFEREGLIEEKNNVLCNGFFTLFGNSWNLPCVIAIGNGDNGSTDPGNAPQQSDELLNSELTNGRFPCVSLENRFDTNTGVATFNSLYPRNAYSGQVTEWGLFAGSLGSVSINSKDSGFLVARIAEDFTKTATEDVDVVWTITVTIN